MIQHLLSGFLDVVLHASVIGLACLGIGWYKRAVDNLQSSIRWLIWGLIFGGLAALTMLQPTLPLPDLLIDVRATMIALATYFGGWAGGLGATAITMIVRLWIGGSMALVGMAGIAVAFIGSLILLQCFAYRRGNLRLWQWSLLGLIAGMSGSAPSFLIYEPSQAWRLVSLGAPQQTAAVCLSTISFAYIIMRVDQSRRNQQALALREQQLVAANEKLTALMRQLDQRNADYAVALEKAEAFSRAKSQFLANMSHELKTPLNAILGFSDLLTLPETTLDSGKIIPYAADINRSGQHLLKIVDDVLSMVRIEADTIVAERAQFRLDKLAEDAINSLRPLLHEKQQRIVTKVDVELRGNGDPALMRQALIHVISNAAKFSPRGALIRIEAEQIDDGTTELRIIDSGDGFDDATREDAFQPFWQRDNSNSREYGGLGLGLSIAQHFIEIQGGKISIDRAASGGACVRLQIAAAFGEAPSSN
ncbi:ATP-binding protein [Dongia soli]|uniref:histidine kinase n=1 Tax=Dongia soli TaxID=600628 RepID=A0ABU5EHB3_9PROT|nr:ATP-binding protein [Dongia soli]MDY0885555.1 ATP-binding protein [Dongia soli]